MSTTNRRKSLQAQIGGKPDLAQAMAALESVLREADERGDFLTLREAARKLPRHVFEHAHRDTSTPEKIEIAWELWRDGPAVDFAHAIAEVLATGNA